jgi:predicted ABC-type transport system involved in lysophospholipase L1 biosynthesis ATPase subunit
MDLLFSLSGDEQRRTVIVVTHDDGVAGRAQRVIRMLDGRLVDAEPSSDVLTPLSVRS